MSRIASAHCPLSDCTLAVDNAENIRNSNEKVLQGLKIITTAAIVSPSPRKSARNGKNVNGVVVAEKVPSVRRERVKVSAHTVTTTTTTAQPTASFQAHRPSNLDIHVFAKPFTPSSTPHRNDPYSLCLLNSPCTPEASFFACYGDATESTDAAEVPSTLHTPIRTRAAGQKPTLGDTTRSLLEMFSLLSTPSKSPVRPTEAVSLAASPERAASPAPSASPSPTSTRVVRKVVSYNVDRTSGRPVPKPKAA